MADADAGGGGVPAQVPLAAAWLTTFADDSTDEGRPTFHYKVDYKQK